MHTRIFHRAVGTIAACLLARLARRLPLSTILAGFLVLVGWGLLRADIVVLKDGFALQGRVKRETQHVHEAGMSIAVSKLNGFYMVDDEARRMIFSHKQVQIAEKDPKQSTPTVRLQSPFPRLDHFQMPPWRYTSIGPWNTKWDRVTKIQTPTGVREIIQHVSVLTPHFLRIDARRYTWNPCFLTSELDPKIVRDLLSKYPDLKTTGGKADAAKRFRIVTFMVQAGWYDRAQAELDSIFADLPDQKERVEKARADLKKLVATEYYELIERAQKAGRHQWAQARLARFPQEGMEERLLIRVRALQASYENLNKSLGQARRFLRELPGQWSDSPRVGEFADALKIVAAELNEDTVNRLEPFVSFCEQAERDRVRGRTPQYSPEQLWALAVTGWLLGSNAAEAKVDTGLRLWRARQIVLDYQRADDSIARERLAAAYRAQKAVAFDELARLIGALPPPDPYEASALKNGPWAAGLLPLPEAALFWSMLTLQQSLPLAPVELQAELPGKSRRGPSYYVQLPPEYHPGKNYPVLFVLHNSGEKPASFMQRWAGLASQYGYLLVSPEWERGRGPTYHYSPEEQAAVFDVLRDMYRRFQVDTDRVFVAVFEEGGNMAYDVCLSHPDLFAGVVVMAGHPRYYARHYWHNAQYLPFYVIDGDQTGESTTDNRQQFERWVPHGYASLYVEYKGRGLEWYEGELRYIFDWMSRKKRAVGFPELGRPGVGVGNGEQFQTMRPTDNRFYWVSADGLLDRHNNEVRIWKPRMTPASVQASIANDNQIQLNVHGFRKATVWLRPGMIDFEKPVTVTVNGKIGWANRRVVPDLATVLEDFYIRGDRQRLFVAKLTFGL